MLQRSKTVPGLGGGGYGIYVRMMRDRGFDFNWYDKYCENIFAKGHEKEDKKYDIVTCFEMMEHEYEPGELLEGIFKIGDSFIFTTDLNIFQDPKRPDNWWYYCTDHGQHVSIYTREALEKLASRFGKKYYSCGMLHIFTEYGLNTLTLKFIQKRPSFFDRMYQRQSLLGEDYKNLTGKSF